MSNKLLSLDEVIKLVNQVDEIDFAQVDFGNLNLTPNAKGEILKRQGDIDDIRNKLSNVNRRLRRATQTYETDKKSELLNNQMILLLEKHGGDLSAVMAILQQVDKLSGATDTAPENEESVTDEVTNTASQVTDMSHSSNY